MALAQLSHTEYQKEKNLIGTIINSHLFMKGKYFLLTEAKNFDCSATEK